MFWLSRIEVTPIEKFLTDGAAIASNAEGVFVLSCWFF